MSIQLISSSVEANLYQGRADKLPDLVFRNHVLTNLFKHKKVSGDPFKQPLKIGYGNGESATFATSQANQTDDNEVAFLVPFGQHYFTKSVNLTDIEACSGNDGAVKDLLENRMETAVQAAADSLERMLVGAAGELGQIATGGISSATITLVSAAQAQAFRPGLKVQWAANLTSATRNSGAVGTVLSVDPSVPSVTFTANIAAIGAAIAVGDLMFTEGTKTSAAAPTVVVGLKGYLPVVRPTAGDSFMSQDRSTDTESLAGLYVDGRNKDIKTAIEEAAAKLLTRGGANPDFVLLSASNWNKLSQVLQGFGGASVVEHKGRVATACFKAIELVTCVGTLKVIAVPAMDDAAVYVIDSSTWYIGSPSGDIIKNGCPNGLYVVKASADAIELRERVFGQLFGVAPGFNAVIQMQ